MGPQLATTAPVILAGPGGSTIDGPVAGGGARRGLRDQGRAAWPLGVLPGLSGLEPQLDGDRRQLELGMMGHFNVCPDPIESGRAAPDRGRARFERHSPVARPRMFLGRVHDRGTLAAGQLLEPPPRDGVVPSHFSFVLSRRRLADEHERRDYSGESDSVRQMLRPQHELPHFRSDRQALAALQKPRFGRATIANPRQPSTYTTPTFG